MDMKTIRNYFLIIVGLLALALVSVAAQEKSTSEKASEAWDATKQTTQDVGSKVAKGTRQAANRIEAAIQKPDADARKVNVKVSERGVQMPNNLSAGKTAFVVKNTGKEAHNFEIEGNAIEKSFWISLPPNETKTMQVELKPGTYEANCRVKGHEGKEPKTQLVVK